MKIHLSIVFLFLSIILFAQNDSILKTYSKNQLLSDYDLVVSSLKEAHPGLYWYTSYSDFEKIFQSNRNKIKEGMSSYEFYRILSEVLSADKEGHSSVFSSKDIGQYVKAKGKYLPFGVKVLNKKIYLINDIGTLKTKGKILTEINNKPIDSILSVIFKSTSRYSDGFSTTGKYKLLDRFSFAGYYMDFISDFKSSEVSITLLNPVNDVSETHTIDLVNREGFVNIARQTPRKSLKHSGELFNLETKNKLAILSFNSFGYRDYEKQNTSFKTVIDSLFRIIEKNKTKDLIIDIRNTSGGSEGAEDYLFSYLTDKPYKKYEYVQSNGFSYSFLDYTDYKDDRAHLENMLVNEHELQSDGRILRKASVLPTELPKSNPYNGNLYILISGKTYSGGSEFASIAKSNSDAVFIGEETGGGFYGQTSGSYVFLLLPNTQMEIRIPLLKFSTTFKSQDIPFGRGVIPDYEVEQTFEEYNNAIDVELEYALGLIKGRK